MAGGFHTPPDPLWDIYEKKMVGVVLNRVGSARHEAMLRASFAAQGLEVLGSVPRDGAMERESRHLGLVHCSARVCSFGPVCGLRSL